MVLYFLHYGEETCVFKTARAGSMSGSQKGKLVKWATREAFDCIHYLANWRFCE